MAPRIFNLFSEALHWVFETLLGWDLTHYLDDFLFVFPPGTDIQAVSDQYNHVLTSMGFMSAPEKDMNGHIVTHLGFEFDSLKMQIRLPANKKQRALQAVRALLNAKSVSPAFLDEALGFLAHCCQVVPLGRPFLRNVFAHFAGQKSQHVYIYHRQRKRTSNGGSHFCRHGLQLPLFNHLE